MRNLSLHIVSVLLILGLSLQASASLVLIEDTPIESNEILDSETTEVEETTELISRTSFSSNYRETPKVFRLIQLCNYAEIETFFPSQEKTHSTSLHKVHESYLM